MGSDDAVLYIPTVCSDKERCLYCAAPLVLVWVHGHAQCASCKVNVVPCCDGAVAGEGHKYE